METLYFSRLRPGAVLPSKRREDAGYDIYLCLEEDPVCLEPHETRALPAGIASACDPGYYFQIGPHEAGYPGGNMLASGDYCFNPKALRILREDICNDNGEFEKTLRQAPLFSLDNSDMLKRVPNGFPKDAPFSPYLMYRTYCLVYEPGKDFMLKGNLLERTIDAFRDRSGAEMVNWIEIAMKKA